VSSAAEHNQTAQRSDLMLCRPFMSGSACNNCIINTYFEVGDKRYHRQMPCLQQLLAKVIEDDAMYLRKH
jgi:hypothetical protein